jgi:hypothetical protein
MRIRLLFVITETKVYLGGQKNKIDILISIRSRRFPIEEPGGI